jgi:glycosyltransferase involved in cell wall biosynthesis
MTVEAALVSSGLGLGGTEKGLVQHATLFDPERVRVRVVTVTELGPRADQLRAAGIPVHTAGGDPRRLAELLDGVQVVHVYRGGLHEPVVPEAARSVGAALVETNVFGDVDAGAQGAFDCHLFVSMASALRYRDRLGLAYPAFHERHRVSYWPVDIERLRALAPAPDEAKRRLGLDPARPVVSRIGRDDDRKWRAMLVSMLPDLLAAAPETQVLLVGVTPAKRAQLRRLGLLHRVRIVAPSADEERLAAMYAATDVFVTAAERGESGSVAIEEAMAVGLPVVTCSTPWADNAQIEQVDHGATGFIANHPREMADAVAQLLGDPDLRHRFAGAAAAKAARLYDGRALTRQLEHLYAALTQHGRPPDDWRPSAQEVEAFDAGHDARAATHFRPLSARERLDVHGQRARDIALWLGRSARRADLDLVRAALAQARAKVLGLRRRRAPGA